MANELFHKIMEVLKLEPKPIEGVRIKSIVIGQIVELAQEVYPREFVALLEGQLNENILEVTSVIFHPFFNSATSASLNSLMYSLNHPILSHVIGTVHSHPGSSNRPSQQDLASFSRTGCIHLIISKPFNKNSIAAYTCEGEQIEFDTVD